MLGNRILQGVHDILSIMDDKAVVSTTGGTARQSHYYVLMGTIRDVGSEARFQSSASTRLLSLHSHIVF